MSIIYAPHYPFIQFDFNPAYYYGDEIEFIIPKPQIFRSDKREDNLARLERAMERYTEDDWLLPVGSPDLIGLMFAYAARSREPLNILRWDRKSQRYTAETVEIT